MAVNLKGLLESQSIETSAPCRIDMGGTLDISVFHYPLRHLSPCTFNIAVDLRTWVRLRPHTSGKIKISSRGFEAAEFARHQIPPKHPLGFMFAIADYFGVHGVHVDIESTSPPMSALGGSSAAAVALIDAVVKACEKLGIKKHFTRKQTALLAHSLEESVNGFICGLQDHLAAVFGGVNAWYWLGDPSGALFKRQIVAPKKFHRRLDRHLLLAYCGIPHSFMNINGKWIQQFLDGQYHDRWAEITVCTQQFIRSFADRDYETAATMMNRETAIRREMTPDVLDDRGEKLVDAAVEHGCGARFTGAGGGGCIWALGEIENIDKLKTAWQKLLAHQEDAGLLDVSIDSNGVMHHT